MSPDEAGQYDNGTNYPRPVFVLVGPSYLKVYGPDEMAAALEERRRWEEELDDLRLYVKLPFDSRLHAVWPKYPPMDKVGTAAVGLVILPAGSDLMDHNRVPLELNVFWFHPDLPE